MIVIATASADTYITNKLIDALPAVSGNVGRAGTIDLFKLYDESTYVTGTIELSRALLKFDLAQVSRLASSSIDITDPSFRAIIRLRSLSVGQPTPSNFTLDLHPLANPFDEGIGRDVISFADIDYASYLERTSGSAWNVTGAGAAGTLGSAGIDYYVSGNLQDGQGVTSLRAGQTFATGLEDLAVDVTRIVSATIAGVLPDSGFRLSFSAEQETDGVTRFVKRFASRHVREASNRPTLTVSYDNSVVDNHSSSYFDTANALVVHNTVRGGYRNFLSGALLTPVTGSNCAIVRLATGSFVSYVTASQVIWGGPVTGIYSASFTLLSVSAGVITGSLTVASALAASGSVTFDERWTSLDGTVTFFSGSVTLQGISASPSTGAPRKLRASVFSTPATTTRGNPVRLRVAFYDDYENNRSSRFPVEPHPLQVSAARIRLRDTVTGRLLFDFDDPGARLSNDALSNYYDIETHGFPVGIPLSAEFRFDIDGQVLQLAASYRLTVSE